MVAKASDRYPGTGLDGSAPTELSDKVDPKTDTHNVDGLRVKTRGNVIRRAVKHARDCGSINKDETLSEMSSGTKHTKAPKGDDGKAKSVRADTGVFASLGRETFMSPDGDKAAGEMSYSGGEPGDKTAMRALTGNLYRTIHADDAKMSDSVKIGFAPENNETPFDRANIEPTYTTSEIEPDTCARECGLGEISVRGIGVRVLVAVSASNGHRSRNIDTKANSTGGISHTNRINDGNASTIGLVVEARMGETDAQPNPPWRIKRTPMKILPKLKVVTPP